MTIQKYYFLLLLFASAFQSFGQAGIYNEADIEEQNAFIDAIAFQFAEKHNKSVEELDKLISTAPDKAVLYFERAKALADLENLDKAYIDIKRAIKFDNSKISFFQLKYDIEGTLGEYEEQVLTAEHLIKLEPNNIYNYYDTYNCYRTISNDKQALVVLDNIINIFGIDERTTNSKLELLNAKNDQAGITATLEKLISAYPNNLDYRHRLAEHLVKINEPEAADKVYEKILKIQPDDPVANLVNLKKNQSAQGSDLSVLEAIISNEEMPLDPKILELIPYIQKMSIDRSYPDNLKLNSLLNKLNTVHPNSAKVHSIIGDFYYNSGQFENAIDAYKKTIDFNNGVFVVWDQMLRSTFYTQDLKSLGHFSEELIEVFPNKVEGYYYQALYYILSNNFAEAESYIQEGGLIAGKDNKKQDQMTVAKMYLALSKNDFDSASNLSESLTDFAKNEAIASKIIGDVQSAQGKKKKAVSSWKQAYRLGYITNELKDLINASGS